MLKGPIVLSDFLSDIQGLFADAISPEIFKIWTGISMVAGAMERRVWARNIQGVTYAGLYVLLVAPPGIGKGIINRARRVWTNASKPGSKSPAFHVAPDSVTSASLIDELADARNIFIPPKGAPYAYHSLIVASEELAVFLPENDRAFIGRLNSIWNTDAEHRERRRHGKPPVVVVENPQLNILAGTQPSYLATLFPEDAWNTGIARRLIMIYSADRVEYDLFGAPASDEDFLAKVLARLGEISTLWGEMTWSAQAIGLFRDWRADGEQPQPQHSKLIHYNQSRSLLLFKLCMISSICRGNDLIIEPEDFGRARSWMLLAERYMPDVFRAMIGKSDKDVMDELHRYATIEYARSKRTPLNGQTLRRFLLERVPHDKVESLLYAADKAGLVQRLVTGDMSGAELWVPKPRVGIGGFE